MSENIFVVEKVGDTLTLDSRQAPGKTFQKRFLHLRKAGVRYGWSFIASQFNPQEAPAARSQDKR